MSSSRESTACKFFGKQISRHPSPIIRTRNSHCSVIFYWRLEKKQRRRSGWKGFMELVRDFAEESARAKDDLCSLPYNRIKMPSNIISAKKVIAKCTSYSINTAIPHPISTTALIAPHVLPDKIFIIYRRHPDHRTHGSIPMCPSTASVPVPVLEYSLRSWEGDFRVWVVMVGEL